MSTPRKPSWKPDAATPASPSGGGDAAWKPGAPKPASGPSWLTSKWTQVGIVVTLLLGIAVGAIVWIFLPSPDPAPGLVLIEAGYENHLPVPHNVAGRNAIKALEKWADEHSGQEVRGAYAKVEVKKAPLEVGAEDAIKAIQSMRTGWFGKPRKKVIIYIATHGVALPDPDRPSEYVAYLVPEGHDPARPEGLFKVDDLLKAIEDNLPASTQKLLVLDCSGVR